MIKTTPIRNTPADDTSDKLSIFTATPEDLIGRVIVFEPSTWSVMLRVRDAVRLGENGEIKITGHDVLTNQDRTCFLNRYPPNVSFPEPESTYERYALQHRTGDGEWVDTTALRTNPHSTEGYYGEYTGHEPQRLRFKRAVYYPESMTHPPIQDRVEISEGTFSLR